MVSGLWNSRLYNIVCTIQCQKATFEISFVQWMFPDFCSSASFFLGFKKRMLPSKITCAIASTLVHIKDN